MYQLSHGQTPKEAKAQDRHHARSQQKHYLEAQTWCPKKQNPPGANLDEAQAWHPKDPPIKNLYSIEKLTKPSH